MDLVPAGITEKRPFLRFAKKRISGQNSVFFSQKNTRNPLKEWFLFWKRVLFSCTTLPGRGLNMVSTKKWTFFGPKNSDFGLKIRFCFRTPFVSFGETVDLAPADRFFDFSFPIFRKIGVFCKYVFGMQNGKLATECKRTNLHWFVININLIYNSFHSASLKTLFCNLSYQIILQKP